MVEVTRARLGQGAEPDFQRLLERLGRIEARLAEGEDAPALGAYSDGKLATVAAAVYRARRRRARFFAGELFAEPAWDMLLDLFVSRALGKRVSTTSLCLAAEVPQATGLRWISQLEKHGLLHRFKAPEDARVVLIEITPRAYRLMREYMTEGIERHEMPEAV